MAQVSWVWAPLLSMGALATLFPIPVAYDLAGLLLQEPPWIPDLEDLCQHPFFPSSIPAAVLSSAVGPFFRQTCLLQHPSSPGCHHRNSSKERQSCTGYLPISPQILNAVGWMFFRIELLLQSQRPEVEEMIRDMGVGQSAVEQLAVYCVSLKKYVFRPTVQAQD